MTITGCFVDVIKFNLCHDSSEECAGFVDIYCSLTPEGMTRFKHILNSGVQIKLQILDLSNNDIGSEAPSQIRHLIPNLISLNLSHTKLGKKGTIDLALFLKEATTNNNNVAIMRSLDLS